jgi:hypothetical protein
VGRAGGATSCEGGGEELMIEGGRGGEGRGGEGRR